MSELRTDVRVKAEGLGVTGKTIVTFLVLYYDSKQGANGDLALLAFALGQLSYSICVLLKYVNSYGMQSLRPKYSIKTKSVTYLFVSAYLSEYMCITGTKPRHYWIPCYYVSR
jgi:oligosaccharide translocation protein RFT1